MVIKAQRGDYRIVDDLPEWGGYYMIEHRKMYGDCEVWDNVYPGPSKSTSDYDAVIREFNRLTE